MGRMWTVEVENATYTNAGGDFTILELDPAADRPIKLCGLELVATSELMEAGEEWIRLRVIRYTGGTFTSSNGTAATPRPLEGVIGDTAGFAAETFGATIASSTGTAQGIWSTGFNVRAGYGPVLLPPEYRVLVPGAANTALVVNGLGTVTDDVSMNLTAWVEEYG